jgi:RNA polymerase-binding transcription factor
MDESTLAGFRELLGARLRGILNGGYGPGLKLANVGLADPMDAADMASHHCDQELVHSIRYRNQQLVQEIRSAIQRIDEGEFGTCSLCSASIGLERLCAQPTAMLCIRCQEILETLKRRLPAA